MDSFSTFNISEVGPTTINTPLRRQRAPLIRSHGDGIGRPLPTSAVRSFNAGSSDILPVEDAGGIGVSYLLQIIPLPVQPGGGEAPGRRRPAPAAAVADSGLP